MQAQILPKKGKRDPFLDLLRATAILLVVSYHVHGMWPGTLPGAKIAKLGAFGVDLFFVLSGWLIGRIYWRTQFDSVGANLIDFWKKRWLRTIPPYAIALTLAWASVWWSRREAFDLSYLFFLQNFKDRIPFFLVSWSLCVEEHAYIVIPVVLLIVRNHAVLEACSLLLLSTLPTAFRFAEVQNINFHDFGYSQTATHLRVDGIAFGFVAAWVRERHSLRWPRLSRCAKWTILPLLILFVSLPWFSDSLRYVAGGLIVNSTFVAVLSAFVEKPPMRIAKSSVIYWIAISSYSTYLTHSLAIHVSLLICRRWNLAGIVAALLWGLVLFVAAFGFFAVVERPCLYLKDRVAKH